MEKEVKRLAWYDFKGCVIMFCGYCGKENSKDYSFCAGCGKPLEGDTPNQSTQPEDNSKNLNTSSQGHQEVKSNEENIPESKYLSVTWWKECAWPWQARSLDGRTLLGSYETKEKAADVVAKFHGIDRIDLLMITDDSEKKKEDLLRKLRKKATDEEEKVKATNNPEISKSESAMGGHTSTPPQSEIKEHLEAPSLRESVKAKTLSPDKKREMHTGLCSECKGPLPEELPYEITICSTNCYNKFWYKHYRFQLRSGIVFGVIVTLSTWGTPFSVASGIFTFIFVYIKNNQMDGYPWR